MKKIYIVANWKSNLTSAEANSWLQRFKNYDLRIMNKEIIICPPYTLFAEVESRIKNQELRIKLGAQDVSPFDEGAYTGEVSAKQIKEFADFAIIGHSERRQNFKEDDKTIDRKIDQAFRNSLNVILCISDIKQIQNSEFRIQNSNSKLIIAYEPLFAIGSGNPDTPENANNAAEKIKEIINAPVLYGGSVTPENVNGFTTMDNIDGVLVGGASLDAQEFYKIIQKA